MSKLEQLGPYQLEQRPGVFPLGSDTLALGRFATVRKGWRVCDLGTGSGVLLLLLAAREPQLELFGLDQDPAAAALAQDNLRHNGLEGQIWTGSWSQTPFQPGSFDLVVSNPPYYAPGSGKDGGPARMEREELDALCRAAARLLRTGGLPCRFPPSGWLTCWRPCAAGTWSPSGSSCCPTRPQSPPTPCWSRGYARASPVCRCCPARNKTRRFIPCPEPYI